MSVIADQPFAEESHQEGGALNSDNRVVAEITEACVRHQLAAKSRELVECIEELYHHNVRSVSSSLNSHSRLGLVLRPVSASDLIYH